MMIRVTKLVCAVVGFLVVAGVIAPRPAAAQSGNWDVAAGYSFLNDNEIKESFGAGWFAAVGVDVSKALAIAGEVSGNYKTVAIAGTDVDLSIHFFGAGPRFVGHTAKVHPFAQVLFGAARGSAGLLGVSESATDFAWQPGGGIDIDLNKSVGLRVGANGRFIHGDDDTTSEFQVQIGIVFRSKK